MDHNFNVGDKVIAYFTEHSIPTHIEGVVTQVMPGMITVRSTDGWKGEAGRKVSVPYTHARLIEETS